MKKIIIIFLFLNQFAFSQEFSDVKSEKIEIPKNQAFYFPTLSPDGNKLILTKQNFTGLYLYDIYSKTIVKISDKQGAGYNPVFSENGLKVFFRENEYEGMRKISSIYEYNINKAQKSIIETKKRNVSSLQIVKNQLYYTVDNKAKNLSLNNTSDNIEDLFVLIETQKIVLYVNGVKKVLSPKGEGNYIWPSLSPDNTKILFTFAGHGTFVSDLNGNIISELGVLNAPKWYDNNWIVGMKENDDGNQYTSSDIFAVSLKENQTVQLTNTKDIIELYPDCSSQNSKIVYHTPTGGIYLLKIEN